MNTETVIYVEIGTGRYLGAFVGDHVSPPDSMIVPFAPSDSRQIWEVNNWAELDQPVPSQVTMRQARLALLNAGLLAQVEGAIDQLPGAEGQAARIEWEYSQVVQRDKPFVVAVGGLLGLSTELMDQLFIAAGGIE